MSPTRLRHPRRAARFALQINARAPAEQKRQPLLLRGPFTFDQVLYTPPYTKKSYTYPFATSHARYLLHPDATSVRYVSALNNALSYAILTYFRTPPLQKV